MVAAEFCIRGTAHRVIFGNDYYALLHAHTMVHASLFTIHLEALARWLINEEKYMECMLAFNVHPLLDALSEKNVEKTSACANATQVKMCHNVMVEFDKACTIHKAMANIHKHGDDSEAVYPC